MAADPQIVVVGTGYVGLPAALMLARAGWRVVGVDINENIVRAINEGVLHLKEADLQALLDDPAVRQNLRAPETSSLTPAGERQEFTSVTGR